MSNSATVSSLLPPLQTCLISSEPTSQETSSPPKLRVSSGDALASIRSPLDYNTHPWGMARPWDHSFHVFNLFHFEKKFVARLGRLYRKLPRLSIAGKDATVSLSICQCYMRDMDGFGDFIWLNSAVICVKSSALFPIIQRATEVVNNSVNLSYIITNINYH